MRFSDIPGHASAKDALRALADSDRIPHAIMLAGPSGIGKMLLARTFANYVHCTDPQDGEPCGKCRACRQHASFNNPDMHFIFPIVKSEARKRLLSTDEIENWKDMLTRYPAMPPEKWLEIIEAGNSQPKIYVTDAEAIIRIESYSTFSSRYKIFLVWLPERMQPETANKLLKVIEEPTPGTIFILVSNEPDRVLPTILSRTQRFNLSPLSREDISDYLMRCYNLPDYQAWEFARLSEGRLSKADDLGGHSEEAEEFEGLFKDVMRAVYARKIMVLKNLSDSCAAFGREKLMRFLDYMSRMTRENFIYNLHLPEVSRLTRSEEEFSRRFSPFIHHSNVEEIIGQIGRASADISRNANARIVMFDLFLLLITALTRKPA